MGTNGRAALNGSKRIIFEFHYTTSQARHALAALILLLSAAELDGESLTLTTYYPAPSGVYTKMITTGDTIISRNGGAVNIGSAAEPATLLINGNVPPAGYVLTSTITAGGLGTGIAWKPAPTTGGFGGYTFYIEGFPSPTYVRMHGRGFVDGNRFYGTLQCDSGLVAGGGFHCGDKPGLVHKRCPSPPAESCAYIFATTPAAPQHSHRVEVDGVNVTDVVKIW